MQRYWQKLKSAALAISFAAFAHGPAAAQEAYSFGVVPQFEAIQLSNVWTPLLAEVSRRSGVTLRMEGSPKIPEFEKSFQDGAFDFAYMNPYHSLIALETQGYAPLVRNEGETLFGVLVVRADSEYQQVSDLAGQTIAFPAPNALGASLLMRAQLDREFALDFEASYVETHSSAYLNVILGEAAAAGGVMGTFNQLDPQIRDQLRIIFTTLKSPGHPIVAHPRVPADVVERVQAAFIEIGQEEDWKEILGQVPMPVPVAASVDDYVALKNLNLGDYYIESE